MMNFRSALLVSLLGALAACEPTELITPDAGSCEGLEGLNRWPWFEAEAPLASSTGFEVGDTAPDFRLTDQHGDPTCLWQMSGKYVLVDASALWCEPCKQIAKHTSCVADSFDGDLVYLTFIAQDLNFQPAEPEDATRWSDDYGLGESSYTPVLADGNKAFVQDSWAGASFPAFMLLGPDMTVIGRGDGVPGEAAMKELAAEELGTTVPDCKTEEPE